MKKIFFQEIKIWLLAMAIYPVFSLMTAIPTYYLWNWLMPEILAVKAISFWQAWGINLLTGLLFKNYLTFKKTSK